MANTFTEIVDTIFARGLMALRENAIMPRIINTDWSAEVAEQGDTIDVPIPSAATVSDVTPGPTPPAGANSAPTKVSIPLNKWRKSDMHVTDKEAREIAQGARDLQLSEHLRALANDVDDFILGLYKSVYGFAGTSGTTPFASDLTGALDAGKVLADQLAPPAPRRIVLNPAAEANAKGLRAIQDATFRANQENTLLNGQIGTVLGFDWFMNQNIPTHTAGPWAADSPAPTVSSGSVGDETLVIDTGAGADTDHVLEGDVFTIAGDSQTYVVTADATTDASGGATISISPSLQVAISGSKNITVESTHAVNLAFHRDAFALAVRPLAPADGFTGGNEIRTGVDPVSGLALTLEVSREYNRTKYQWSVLYGAQLIRAELASRIAGEA